MLRSCSYGQVKTSIWGKTFEFLNVKFYMLNGELCEEAEELKKLFKTNHFDFFWLNDGYILVAKQDGQIDVIFKCNDVDFDANKTIESCIFSQIEQVDVWEKIFDFVNVKFHVISDIKLHEALTIISNKIGVKHFDLYEINDSYLIFSRKEDRSDVILMRK